MFALGLCYLNGWSMAAADGARKEQAEWPPHPDRVFMALAAAWFETGEDAEEGEALRWLEALPPPAIAASNATVRAATVSYVPVNDAGAAGRKVPTPKDPNKIETFKKKQGKLKESGLSTLPEHRSRQPRGFPVAIPHDPTVHLIWPEAKPSIHGDALERLAAKVTHVGHSASFVQAWVDPCPPEPIWIPDHSIAARRLRVTNPGRLRALKTRMNRTAVLAYRDLRGEIEQAKAVLKKMKPPPTRSSREQRRHVKKLKADLEQCFPDGEPATLRPLPGRWQGYGRPTKPEPAEETGSVFDPALIVLGIQGRRVSLPATLKLTAALRGALMKSCTEQPPPEWFSGHKPGGGATAEPHLALFPLPFVGDRHADGRIMGLALALPRRLDRLEASRCLEAFLFDANGLPQSHRLFDGRWFTCTIEMEDRERPPKNLTAATWTRPSRIWASVTPVVLNRHFDGKDRWERAAESVKEACMHIGLPRPREALLHPVSLAEGAPHTREFPRLTRKSDGGRRSHSHAVIVFDTPVAGPVLIGAGRFRGYGLCRPMDGGGDDG